jgi:hypothetical protein
MQTSIKSRPALTPTKFSAESLQIANRLRMLLNHSNKNFLQLPSNQAWLLTVFYLNSRSEIEKFWDDANRIIIHMQHLIIENKKGSILSYLS